MKNNFSTKNVKNPLIPMVAVTGDISRSQIEEILQCYHDKGIEQFLIYPRDGCEVAYMSARWLEICKHFVQIASSIGMAVWLYDEFNWPSGTCLGAVQEENPDFVARCIQVVDGQVCIKQGYFSHNGQTTYADLMNAHAVDCFIAKTHQVYFDNFGEYFGNTVKGIFTDEPSFLYFSANCETIYPYTDGLENLYQQEYGRDLFEDILAPTPQFNNDFFALVGKLFRQNYVEKIQEWCSSHGVALTGHLMNEHDIAQAVIANGDILGALSAFALPGIDEINTYTGTQTAEWITLGTLQYVSRLSKGGLAELFALGPTDLPPARIDQMIWLSAMFGATHYALAVSATDARGNVKKDGWFNPMNYTNPWFEGFPLLGESAKQASCCAKKSFTPDVWVRYPLDLAKRHISDGKAQLISQRLYFLLARLTEEQYQWQFLAEDESVPQNGVVIQIEDTDDWSIEKIVHQIKIQNSKQAYVLEGETLAKELLVRRYDDGQIVLLDLTDSHKQRNLVVVDGDSRYQVQLVGRGHLIVEKGQPQKDVICLFQPVLQLTIDRPNTLRCNLNATNSIFKFIAKDNLSNIKLLVRNYCVDGKITLDGNELTLSPATNVLTRGLIELYSQTEPFTLTKGEHVVCQTATSLGEPYLPSCFVAGYFAVNDDYELSVLPAQISSSESLHQIIPQFAGKITFSACVTIPKEKCSLIVDGGCLYTQIFVNGQFVGESYNDYKFEIPQKFLGKTVDLDICQFTTIAPIFGRLEHACTSQDYTKGIRFCEFFPHKYKDCGIKNLRFEKN